MAATLPAEIMNNESSTPRLFNKWRLVMNCDGY